jgi:NADPH2:quinone reductase
MLDPGPTELSRTYGMSWGLGGWLLPTFLKKIGPEATQKLRERVVAELETTFASRYTRTISLVEALRLDSIAAYGRIGTGEKYLIDPSKT